VLKTQICVTRPQCVKKMAGYFPGSPRTKLVNINTLCGTDACLNVYITLTAEIIMHLQSDMYSGKICTRVAGSSCNKSNEIHQFLQFIFGIETLHVSDSHVKSYWVLILAWVIGCV